MKIGPQQGAQQIFAACDADIAIYAGQPGSGKSWAGAFEFLRWHGVPDFVGAGFRKNANQLFGGGSLWTLITRYSRALGGKDARAPKPNIRFPSGAEIELHHAQLGIQNAADHDGKEYAVEFFDELPHFDAAFFWYLALLRNRSTCGIKPYVRASAMAQADNFVADLVAPWLLEDGWPDYRQSGKKRWFVRDPNTDLLRFFEAENGARDFSAAFDDDGAQPKSLAVVHARTEENRVLMEANPDYIHGRKQLDRVTRLRMEGNWHAREASAGLFDRAWYRVFDKLDEREIVCSARGWDKASTLPSEENKDPDWTRGVRLDMLRNGTVVVSDVIGIRDRPGMVDQLYTRTAEADGPKVTQSFFRDPAQAGVVDEMHTRAMLSHVKGCGEILFTPTTKNKVAYASPASAYFDRTREVKTAGGAIVRAGWNSQYFSELEQFPKKKRADGTALHDDTVDAQSAAWIAIAPRLPRVFQASSSWLQAMERARL